MGGRHSTEEAFALPTQPSRVWFSVPLSEWTANKKKTMGSTPPKKIVNVYSEVQLVPTENYLAREKNEPHFYLRRGYMENMGRIRETVDRWYILETIKRRSSVTDAAGFEPTSLFLICATNGALKKEIQLFLMSPFFYETTRLAKFYSRWRFERNLGFNSKRSSFSPNEGHEQNRSLQLVTQEKIMPRTGLNFFSQTD